MSGAAKNSPRVHKYNSGWTKPGTMVQQRNTRLINVEFLKRHLDEYSRWIDTQRNGVHWEMTHNTRRCFSLSDQRLTLGAEGTIEMESCDHSVDAICPHNASCVKCAWVEVLIDFNEEQHTTIRVSPRKKTTLVILSSIVKPLTAEGWSICVSYRS